MSSFELEQRPPSVDLSVDLVRSLESFITEDLADELVPEGGQEAVQEALKVVIQDGLGEETLGSMAEFRPARFRNSTKQVSLRLWLRYEGLRLTACFSAVSLSSRIRIEIESSGRGAARRRAVGIYEGILRQLEPHKNLNWTLMPSWWLSPTLFLGGFLVVGMSVELIADDSIWQAVGGYSGIAMFFGSGAQFANAAFDGRLLPYTHFDTQRYNTLRRGAVKAWLWCMGTAAAAAATALGRGLLGL